MIRVLRRDIRWHDSRRSLAVYETCGTAGSPTVQPCLRFFRQRARRDQVCSPASLCSSRLRCLMRPAAHPAPASCARIMLCEVPVKSEEDPQAPLALRVRGLEVQSLRPRACEPVWVRVFQMLKMVFSGNRKSTAASDSHASFSEILLVVFVTL